MKKIVFLIVVFCFVFIVSPMVSFPASAEGIDSKMEASKSTSSDKIAPKTDISEPSKNEYTLPYPGILPDHPLYALKNFRDSILEMLISDPVRKIEFYILQSDKEVSATQFLSLNKKTSFLKHTVEHAVVFKQKAIAQAKLVKSQGKEVPGFLVERLTSSIQKQSDMLSELETTDSDLKKIIADSKTKVSAFQTDIDALKK